jgi:ribonucleoside-diphosphate reductase alpha chain
MDKVKLDYSRDSLFDSHGLERIKTYMLRSEQSPQERFAYVASLFSDGDEILAQRLYDYMSKHWFCPSTPQLSMGKTSDGLPIACFLPFISDTLEGLINGHAEICQLSVVGGGVGIGLGIRQAGEKSSGVLAHLKTYDTSCLAYKQGQTRRGSYAAYLDLSHPEIFRFIESKRSTGDENLRLANIHTAINIPDEFMDIISKKSQGMPCDDAWNLIDPHTGQVVQVVKATILWQTILHTRLQTGEPFLHFIDTSNSELHESFKKLGLQIRQSNLCTEIILPTDESRTAVCCLASLNLEYWNDFKLNDQFFEDILMYLDNVLSYFIKCAPSSLHKAIFSAVQSRAVGVGTMGFHSLLQSRNVSFNSTAARELNLEIFKRIRDKLNVSNLTLAELRGESSDCTGLGKRCSHVMAIAPNATSSIIMGNTSPSIEPFRSVIYKQETLSGTFIVKNKWFSRLLEKKKVVNVDEVWKRILNDNGSVKKLDFLTQEEKDVFKTAFEINQLDIIALAAQRQKFIDQSQSLNLFFSPTVEASYIHNVHRRAWASGLKTLYYCRSERLIPAEYFENCSHCEG